MLSFQKYRKKLFIENLNYLPDNEKLNHTPIHKEAVICLQYLKQNGKNWRGKMFKINFHNDDC